MLSAWSSQSPHGPIPPRSVAWRRAINTASRERVSTAAGTDLKVHALLRLKMSEDAKQVFGRRVAIRPKHPHQTVGRDGCRFFQLPKADGGIDIVAQDRSARLLVAGEHEFD